MKNIFQKIINQCASKQSVIYLRVLSFTESIFFPIPTDALLAPMVLSGKHEWIKVSLIASFWSVMGGIVGYILGLYFFEFIEPLVKTFNLYDDYLSAKNSFDKYGIIFLAIAAFTPVPYKVFTLSAGALNYNFILFVVISFVGRYLRFLLVSYICHKYNEQILEIVNKYILYLTILVILLLIYLWV